MVRTGMPQSQQRLGYNVDCMQSQRSIIVIADDYQLFLKKILDSWRDCAVPSLLGVIFLV